MKSIIKVNVEGDELVIRVKSDDLVFAAENMPDLPMKVINKDAWVKEVAFKLQNDDLGRSNATELGLTALEYLMDEVFTDIIESASDNADLTENKHTYENRD